MRKMSLILVAALAFLVPAGMTACGGNGETAATGHESTGTAAAGRDVLVLDETFDSSTIEVTVGVTIEIQLEGNPTTGYDWTVASGGAPVLVQSGEPYYEPESDLDGAPGVYTWRFEVAEAGTADLRLVYSGPDDEVTPEDSFQISVVTKE